jgi:hypothetical protein
MEPVNARGKSIFTRVRSRRRHDKNMPKRENSALAVSDNPVFSSDRRLVSPHASVSIADVRPYVAFGGSAGCLQATLSVSTGGPQSSGLSAVSRLCRLLWHLGRRETLCRGHPAWPTETNFEKEPRARVGAGLHHKGLSKTMRCRTPPAQSRCGSRIPDELHSKRRTKRNLYSPFTDGLWIRSAKVQTKAQKTSQFYAGHDD